MNERYYLVDVTITSSGAEQRNLTPYDSLETALRKFHQAFGNIGAGPLKVSAIILDNNLHPIKSEIWEKEVEPEPEEEPVTD
jgi:hypothetical protein